MTTRRSERSTASATPDSTCHDKAPKHSPVGRRASRRAPNAPAAGRWRRSCSPRSTEPLHGPVGTGSVDAHMSRHAASPRGGREQATGSIQMATGHRDERAAADGDGEPATGDAGASRQTMTAASTTMASHAHDAERDEQQHQRPTAGDAPGTMVEDRRRVVDERAPQRACSGADGPMANDTCWRHRSFTGDSW